MNFSIKAKISILCAVFLVVFTASTLLLVKNSSDVLKSFRLVVNDTRHTIDKSHDLAKLVVDMETGLRGFCIAHQEQFLDPYTAGGKSFDILIEEEKKLVSDNPSQVAALERIGHLVQEWKQKAAEPEIAMARKVAMSAVDAQHLQIVLGLGVGDRKSVV